jgi:hypothetical protein
VNVRAAFEANAACAMNRRDDVDERQQLGDIFAESSMMGAGIPWSVVQASKVNRYAEKQTVLRGSF